MALIQIETLVLPMDSCVKQSLGDPILRLLLLGDQKWKHHSFTSSKDQKVLEMTTVSLPPQHFCA